MTTSTAPTRAAAMTLRRQKAHTVGGAPDGGYTDTFEIICSACGDDSRRDYQDVPPRLQRLRGPYPLDTGVTQYEAHIAWHETFRSFPRASDGWISNSPRPAPSAPESSTSTTA